MPAAPTVYWDDLAPGAVFEGGAFAVDAAAIKRFAAEFDPRPTHLDEAAAAATFFKGLSASGAHTFAAWARLYHDITPGWALQAGSDMFRVKLLRPVRPGDVLSLRVAVTAVRPHPLRGGFGFVDADHEVRNRAGKPVMTMAVRVMMERRPRP